MHGIFLPFNPKIFSYKANTQDCLSLVLYNNNNSRDIEAIKVLYKSLMENKKMGKNANIVPPASVHTFCKKKINWENVYKFVNSSFLEKDVRSSWIKAVHNVIPTKEK